EKTNRIAELLVACVNPSNLLAAKIAVAGVLGLIQAACWAASAFLAGTLGAQAGSGASIFGVSFAPGDLLWFVTFFLIGYLQIATLFAASASLINRTEDLGSMNGPLIIPIVIAFYLAMYASTAPNAALSVVGSFVPLFSPFVLFTRVEVSNVPLWETSVAIAIQIAAIWAFAIVAGKVYRVGMLLYGRTPKFSQILRTLRA
ncbi:MAG: ABC transporter permease, partial [Candidatus Eremiobacteraeota bacterium]|nr:ABC transporter permease [Candidatus Eremiobacteraeota bacterium]